MFSSIMISSFEFEQHKIKKIFALIGLSKIQLRNISTLFFTISTKNSIVRTNHTELHLAQNPVKLVLLKLEYVQ